MSIIHTVPAWADPAFIAGQNCADVARLGKGDYANMRKMAATESANGRPIREITSYAAYAFVAGILSRCMAEPNVSKSNGLPADRDGKALYRTQAANAARGIAKGLSEGTGTPYKGRAAVSLKLASKGESASCACGYEARIAGKPATFTVDFIVERDPEPELTGHLAIEADAAAEATAAAREGYPNAPGARVLGPEPRSAELVVPRFQGNWEAVREFKRELERDQRRLLRRAFRRGFKSGKLSSKVRVN